MAVEYWRYVHAQNMIWQTGVKKEGFQDELFCYQGILEEMYEKQSLLDSTRGGVMDLLKRRPSAVGTDALHDELTDITSRWKSLNDICKNRWVIPFNWFDTENKWT